MDKCLYCYRDIETGGDFHKVCSLDFFGTEIPPKIDYALDEMKALAQKVVGRRSS